MIYIFLCLAKCLFLQLFIKPDYFVVSGLNFGFKFVDNLFTREYVMGYFFKIFSTADFLTFK